MAIMGTPLYLLRAMDTLLYNIGLLAGIETQGRTRLQGTEMGEDRSMRDAYLVIKEGLIADFGPMASMPRDRRYDTETDARGGAVLPAFCDAHTHIVYAGSREREFEDKIRGLSYEDIARRGGGILNSADLLHNTSEDELYRQALPRARRMIEYGTGSIEIKSGYGLNLHDELKMLRVIARLRQDLPANIVSTFLGAHALPRNFAGNYQGYVDVVCCEMIPAVAHEGLAQYIDVFCDRGFFTPQHTAQILECGYRHGLRPKIHANELDYSGGVEVGVAHNALSVDHLEHTSDDQIRVLKGTATMPTVLPGCSLFSRLPYAPARRMIDAGLGVAAASDYNPGSTPSGNMSLVNSLLCIQMRLTPAEALAATTINGAYAMGLSETTGAIAIGLRADLRITDPVPSLAFLPYSFGDNLTRTTLLAGLPA